MSHSTKAVHRELLTIAEVASTLGVSKSTAYRLAKQMLHAKVGRQIRVPRKSLNTWIRNQTIQPWENSTSAARSTTATTKTSADEGAGSHLEREIVKSQKPSSENSNLRKPIQIRTRPKRF